MILVDFSQICIASIMQNHAAIGANKVSRDIHIEEDMVRHMVLNSLRSYNVKFKKNYGDMVLCLDSKGNWRKDVFPYYKAHRKKDRAASIVDWHFVFGLIDMIRDELKENMPYKVLQVDNAEADDIIGSICHKYGLVGLMPSSAPRILIISGDKDFAQLQKYVNVEQYSPVQKHFINTTNPQALLAEHICRGDRADGVPNMLSADSTFVVEGGRQKKLTKAYMQLFLSYDPPVFDSEAQKQQYERNKKMIDLDEIPLNIQEEVIDQFINTVPASRSGMMDYFTKKRLKNLLGAIGEF